MDTAGVTTLSANLSAAVPHQVASKITPARAREGIDIDAASWRLEPHVCAKCFGRIASMSLMTGESLYCCTNCGHEEVGQDPSVACACGIKLRKPVTGRAVGKPFYDAGIRCHENPKLSSEFPSLFVASYTGAEKAKKR